MDSLLLGAHGKLMPSNNKYRIHSLLVYTTFFAAAFISLSTHAINRGQWSNMLSSHLALVLSVLTTTLPIPAQARWEFDMQLQRYRDKECQEEIGHVTDLKEDICQSWDDGEPFQGFIHYVRTYGLSTLIASYTGS